MKYFATTFSMMVLATILSIGTAQAKPTIITIGTGGITGVYYPTGGAISKMVNQKKEQYNLLAAVESTDGSIYNINTVMSGNLDFGIAQSDSQFQAMKGTGNWKSKGPQTELRAVFSIHHESLTLVAASDSGIKNITDLKGKRVNIGNPGSGQRQNAIDALNAVGIDYKTDFQAKSIKASEAAGLLQDNKIDAFFYTVGHPSVAIQEATSGSRKVLIADITGVESLLDQSPYYAATTIPVKLYPGARNTKDITTFGVKATLITSSRVSDEIVYAITKEVFENFEVFKGLHPAYSTLRKKSMLEALSAPIHPGAMKYYREVGLK